MAGNGSIPTIAIGAASPHQPTEFDFPKRAFGKKSMAYRSFQPSWFKTWKWLHYDEGRDVVFCHTCVTAVKSGKLKLAGNAKDSAFLFNGFSNWKDATVALRSHELSTLHSSAVHQIVTVPATHGDVGEQLSSRYASELANNRHCMTKIGQCLIFLARQGIALRGDGDEKESNFRQLLELRAIDDAKFGQWLEKKAEKYTSPEIQNELLDIFATNVVRSIRKEVSESQFFTLMADEVTDVSNKEQVVICLRHANQDLEVSEEFIGLYHVHSIKSDVLVACLKDVLLRLNLSINNCRGQCYDGAANMRGARSGVATQIQAEEPKAHFTHCHGHALNLAASDTMKKNKLLRNMLDTTLEMTKLIKFSPRRDAIFQKIKAEVSPGTTNFRTLCPTRWTVRAASLQSVIDNYAVFKEVWEVAVDAVHDCEMRARIGGVNAAMGTFDFLFALFLGEMILRHADNLSKTLQSPTLTASDSKQLAELTCQTLQRLRDEESFDLFWRTVLHFQQKHDVSEPELPRRRRVPARFESGSAPAHFYSTTEDLYRPIYFECLSYVIESIRDRFNQPGYAVLQRLENLLLNAAKSEPYAEDLDFVLEKYASDFDAGSLRTQLEIFSTLMMKHHSDADSVRAICKVLQAMSSEERANFSQVCILLKLILVTPATNAASERGASALRRVKTYLRSTMGQARLNHLLVLHSHKERTDSIHLPTCLQEFVLARGQGRRVDVFGKFE